MPIPALTGLYIDQTYSRLVQTQGGEFADGLGQAITLVTSTGPTRCSTRRTGLSRLQRR